MGKITVHRGPFSPFLEEKLFATLASERQHPLDEQVVLVGSNMLGMHLQRRMIDSDVMGNGAKGHIGIRFATFPDLARMILADDAKSQQLTPVTAAVEAGATTAAVQSTSLTYFDDVSDLPRFAPTIHGTLTDIEESLLSSGDIAKCRDINAKKLADIVAVLESRGRILDGLVTTNKLLGAAADSCKSRTVPALGRELHAYGFYDFNESQWRLLESAAINHDIDFYCPIPGDDVHPLRLPLITAESGSGTEHTWAPFVQSFRDRLGKLTPKDIDWSSPTWSSESNKSLGESHGPDHRPQALVLSLPNMRKEVEEIARTILEGVSAGVYEFHDSMVLVRDTESYAPLLSEVFTDSGIPHYAIRTRPLLQTRVGKLVELLLEIRRALQKGRVTRDQLISYARETRPGETRWDELARDLGMKLWESDTSARIQAYIKRIEKRNAYKNAPNETDSRIERANRFNDYLTGLSKLLHSIPDSAPWSQHSEVICRWLDAVASASRDDGFDEGELQKVRQVLQQTGELAAVDERSIPISEYSSAVVDALSSKYTKHGQFQGGVIISEIMQARGVTAKQLFLPGMIEGLFPSRSSQDSILLDSDRLKINRLYGSDDGPIHLRSRRDKEESLLFELTLGSATDNLIMSFPRIMQPTGKSNLPSWFALEVLGSLSCRSNPLSIDELENSIKTDEGTIIFSRVPLGQFIPDQSGDSLDLILPRATTEWELDRSISRRLSQIDRDTAQRYLIAEAPETVHPIAALNARLTKNILTEYEGNVGSEVAGQVAQDKWHPTSLETYANCPFKYFLRYSLNLRSVPRPEDQSEIPYRAVGNVFHSALENLYIELRKSNKLPISEDDSKDLVERLEALIDESIQDELIKEPASNTVMRNGLSELLEIDAHGTIKKEVEGAFGDTLVPDEFELKFDDFRLALPSGRTLTISGKIDRVDKTPDGKAIRVVDYKWTSKAKDATSLDGGTQLQPMLYLLAVASQDPDIDLAKSSAQYRCVSQLSNYEVSTLTGDEASAKLPALNDTLEIITGNIEKGLFPPMRVPQEDDGGFGSGRCGFCDFDLICKSISPDPAVYKSAAKDFESIYELEGIE